MANEVYANGREISCKAASGNSICSFPDVCFTPPLTPATPPGVPIPYPNTGMASDTSGGSKTVKISGKEVMLKNSSYFSKSTGDEAGCAPKKGVLTSKNMGKVYFNAWSMDVKIEGENAVRHLDLMTHNHMSFPGNTGPWPYMDMAAMAKDPDHPCLDDMEKEFKACEGYKPYGDKDPCDEIVKEKPARRKPYGEANYLAEEVAANECLAARRCTLQPYILTDEEKKKTPGCCPPQTPHHLIEASALHDKGRGGAGSTPLGDIHDYNENHAPCVCAEGCTQNGGTHGLMHTFQSASAAGQTETTYGDAKDRAVEAMEKVFPESDCNPDCIKAQLDDYHNKCGIDNSTKIKAVSTGSTDAAALEAAEKMAIQRQEAAAWAKR